MDSKLDVIINMLCDISGSSINKLKSILSEDDTLSSMLKNLLSNIEEIESYVKLKEEEMKAVKTPKRKNTINALKDNQITNVQSKKEHSYEEVPDSAHELKMPDIVERLFFKNSIKLMEEPLTAAMYSDDAYHLIRELEKLGMEEWLLDKDSKKLNKTFNDTVALANRIRKKR